jgi:hypothetical protein
MGWCERWVLGEPPTFVGGGGGGGGGEELKSKIGLELIGK